MCAEWSGILFFIRTLEVKLSKINLKQKQLLVFKRMRLNTLIRLVLNVQRGLAVMIMNALLLKFDRFMLKAK